MRGQSSKQAEPLPESAGSPQMLNKLGKMSKASRNCDMIPRQNGYFNSESCNIMPIESSKIMIQNGKSIRQGQEGRWTLAERKKLTEYCIAHDKDYKVDVTDRTLWGVAVHGLWKGMSDIWNPLRRNMFQNSSSVVVSQLERPYLIWTNCCQVFGLGRVVLYLYLMSHVFQGVHAFLDSDTTWHWSSARRSNVP